MKNCTVTSLSLLFTTRNASDKTCIENQTQVSYSIPFLKNRTIYEICGQIEPGRPQMTIWCMRILRWIPKVTNTYCFPTATMVARTYLNITLYVLFLPCYLLVL